jgi:hypothetical protein
MPMQLTITSELEQRIGHQALLLGIAPIEYAVRLLTEHVPEAPTVPSSFMIPEQEYHSCNSPIGTWSMAPPSETPKELLFEWSLAAISSDQPPYEEEREVDHSPVHMDTTASPPEEETPTFVYEETKGGDEDRP